MSGGHSAGLLVYREGPSGLEVLLAHPGGPFYRKRDEGVWSIPKGLVEPGEEPLETARREYHEETGQVAEGPFHPLPEIRQRSGKRVTAFACPGDWDTRTLRSGTFTIEWPPRSGRQAEFPEVDRAEFLDLATAGRKILPAQKPLLDALRDHLAG